MNFTLSEEQAMLSDMVTRLFERDHDWQVRRMRLAGQARATDALWPRLGELGVLGVLLPEDQGGMGLAPQDGAIGSHLVAKAMGRALATDPFVSNAVVAAPLLAAVGSPAQQQAWLPGLCRGSAQLVLAHLEGGPGSALARTATRATAVAGGAWQLDGHKLGVMDAGTAHAFLVSARTGGGPDDATGISLFLVPRDTPGLTLRSRTGFDGGDVGELVLDGVTVTSEQLLGSAGAALAPMRHAVHRGIAALLGEAVGAMERLLELSLEHLRTRKQFGQPLARFQALQHHVAGMATALEQSHSMALMAVAGSAASDEAERSRAVSAAKALVGRLGQEVGKQAVQLHGGMGMTDEMPVGHYVRRLMVIDATWGNAEEHLEAYAQGL